MKIKIEKFPGKVIPFALITIKGKLTNSERMKEVIGTLNFSSDAKISEFDHENDSTKKRVVTRKDFNISEINGQQIIIQIGYHIETANAHLSAEEDINTDLNNIIGALKIALFLLEEEEQ